MTVFIGVGLVAREIDRRSIYSLLAAAAAMGVHSRQIRGPVPTAAVNDGMTVAFYAVLADAVELAGGVRAAGRRPSIHSCSWRYSSSSRNWRYHGRRLFELHRAACFPSRAAGSSGCRARAVTRRRDEGASARGISRHRLGGAVVRSSTTRATSSTVSCGRSRCCVCLRLRCGLRWGAVIGAVLFSRREFR
jgi:hypothetical protein